MNIDSEKLKAFVERQLGWAKNKLETEGDKDENPHGYFLYKGCIAAFECVLREIDDLVAEVQVEVKL